MLLNVMELATLRYSEFLTYRKVARPVYYSIFDYFWGATKWDVLLTQTCYYYHVQQSIKIWVKKRWHEFFSILANYLLYMGILIYHSLCSILAVTKWNKILWLSILIFLQMHFQKKNKKNLIGILEDPTFW